MALSGHDQQVIAGMEAHFPQGDLLIRLQRRVISWMLAELATTLFGLAGCLLGFALWWPAGACSLAVASLAAVGLVRQLSRSRLWLSESAEKRLKRGQMRTVLAARAVRTWLNH